MSFLLQEILLDPARAGELDNDQLAVLLSQARSTRLLAALTLEMEQAGVFTHLPPQAQRHFQSEITIHEKQKRDLLYDVQKVRTALETVGVKTVLLKGAAYLFAELPVSRGRLITDIDIIVPGATINEAEQALITHGWRGGSIDDYDDRYYRRWGHEIPPLTHGRRDTTLDVHHNILPPTSAPNVNAALLFDELVEIKPGIFTLSLRDMVIHSSTHLFHEGEFHHGLRDVWDLDRMLRDFPSRDPEFWEGLVARARQLDLARSLFYGMTYSRQVFGTPVPRRVLENLEAGLQTIHQPVMDFLYKRAFRPDHPACRLAFTPAALHLLYVRSHYLRMPLYLLLPHLARKAWRRQLDKRKDVNALEAAGK